MLNQALQHYCRPFMSSTALFHIPSYKPVGSLSKPIKSTVYTVLSGVLKQCSSLCELSTSSIERSKTLVHYCGTTFKWFMVPVYTGWWCFHLLYQLQTRNRALIPKGDPFLRTYTGNIGKLWQCRYMCSMYVYGNSSLLVDELRLDCLAGEKCLQQFAKEKGHGSRFEVLLRECYWLFAIQIILWTKLDNRVIIAVWLVHEI